MKCPNNCTVYATGLKSELVDYVCSVCDSDWSNDAWCRPVDPDNEAFEFMKDVSEEDIRICAEAINTPEFKAALQCRLAPYRTRKE